MSGSIWCQALHWHKPTAPQRTCQVLCSPASHLYLMHEQTELHRNRADRASPLVRWDKRSLSGHAVGESTCWFMSEGQTGDSAPGCSWEHSEPSRRSLLCMSHPIQTAPCQTFHPTKHTLGSKYARHSRLGNWDWLCWVHIIRQGRSCFVLSTLYSTCWDYLKTSISTLAFQLSSTVIGAQ